MIEQGGEFDFCRDLASSTVNQCEEFTQRAIGRLGLSGSKQVLELISLGYQALNPITSLAGSKTTRNPCDHRIERC